VLHYNIKRYGKQPSTTRVSFSKEFPSLEVIRSTLVKQVLQKPSTRLNLLLICRIPPSLRARIEQRWTLEHPINICNSVKKRLQHNDIADYRILEVVLQESRQTTIELTIDCYDEASCGFSNWPWMQSAAKLPFFLFYSET